MSSKWDGYTGRSRKILQLANQAATLAGAHEICTGHLLFAILQEGGGVAVHALVALGQKRELLLAQVRETMSPLIQPFEYRKVPFSQLVEDTIVYAGQEA
jgi:ATP-dependent Clp protease ATP-binding subunit ClpA